MQPLWQDRTFTQPVVGVTTFFMIAFHIGAIAALFFFTWKAFFVAIALWWIAGGVGIGMGYHRLLTHRGYKTPKWMEYVLTVCGTLTLEGGPIFWVAIHRMHHQNTDKEGDPHSPQDGGLWAHVGWILTGQSIHDDSAVLLPFVPEPSQRQVPRLDQPMALGSHDSARCRPFVLWRMAFSDVGHLLPHSPGSSLDLASQLGHPYVGIEALPDGRHLSQQLLGRAPHLRRRMAQQPSCPPTVLSTRPGLVRVRSELVRHLRTTDDGPRLGRKSRKARSDRLTRTQFGRICMPKFRICSGCGEIFDRLPMLAF